MKAEKTRKQIKCERDHNTFTDACFVLFFVFLSREAVHLFLKTVALFSMEIDCVVTFRIRGEFPCSLEGVKGH